MLFLFQITACNIGGIFPPPPYINCCYSNIFVIQIGQNIRLKFMSGAESAGKELHPFAFLNAK